MSHREPLKDFQRRLADRLQAASGEGVKATWLAVEAGQGRYLLPLAQAGEIFPADTAHPVPYTQPWFLGVASLRGHLYAVADLAGLVTRNSDGLLLAPAAHTQAQWITLNPALDMQCALQVDRLAGLRAAQAFSGTAAPAVATPTWFGPVYQDRAGTCWQVLDLLALTQQAGFLRIGT